MYQRKWTDKALCKGMGPDLFYPPPGAIAWQRLAEIRPMCEICPVRRKCLEEALQASTQHGIWAGLGERERMRIRRLHGAQREARIPEVLASGVSHQHVRS